ncbi:MAG: dehydrogenase [Bacteroidales bacterium]|jgi:D-glycero-alpha-D-manno-heptose-7-phosphate kinase|nr:dehydrogenase [Bacteroidales bacterium]
MIIRSKAPLRLGLAGGGTDVTPYSDLYGGATLNATINMYAYATIIPSDKGKIVIRSIDKNVYFETDAVESIPIDGSLNLLKGIYNRVVRDFTHSALSFELYTYVDAPLGSGLGTSSTLVVAVLGAFAEWLRLPLGEYDLARLAYQVERIDLQMAGGKQDQYAATFGGVNFMEFYKDDKVIVNPLRIKSLYLNELSHNLILYHTKTSRVSSSIIERQARNIIENKSKYIEATHKLKEQAIMMKEAILKGSVDEIGPVLDFGWKYKKMIASGITNHLIDNIYDAAIESGATGGKISGAGGGGFMIFYCPENKRYEVIESLRKFGGASHRYEFTTAGMTAWTI